MATGETIILGVLNLTPDSFSDGSDRRAQAAANGSGDTIDWAVARAEQMRQQGATLIDVGGESTRPGATLVGPAEEQRRILPFIRRVAGQGFDLSVDTINASTAEAAVLAGVRTINDVSGGLYDPAMLETVARLSANFDVDYIIGHWRGVPDPNHLRSTYGDVVADIATELVARAEAAIDLGVPRERIVLDPGLGFDKTAEQCWQVLRRIDELHALGYRICVGVSRKRMLADIVQETTGGAGSFTDRDLATSVVTALAARAGIWAVRVHEVLGSAQALSVVRNWPGAGPAMTGAEQTRAGADRPAAHASIPTPMPTPDTVTLTGLEVFAHHGVFHHERENGQRFLIDISVTSDLRRAAEGDDLTETVHYGELAERVVHAVQHDPVDLIETVAERVAQVALRFAAAQSVRVTVHKPDAPINATFADVSVTIERSRQ